MPRWLARLLDLLAGPPAPVPPGPAVLPMPPRPAPPVATRPGVAVPPAGEASLTTAINRRRIEANLSTLAVDPVLTAAARWIAGDNARSGYLSHVGSDGSSVGDRVGRLGYDFGWVGECGDEPLPGADADRIADDWLRSPAHKAIMLSPSPTQMGVGLATAPDGRVFAFLTVARPR